MIKSYTDIEQSKKLVEILPLKSADMYYFRQIDNDYFPPDVESICPIPFYKDNKVNFKYDIPCWSLAALLDVIKDDIKIEKTLFDQSDMFTYSIIGDCCEYRTYEHEELVDACVEMIVKLKEKDLI